MEKIKRLIAINVPFTKCNLKCKYCYLSQRNEWDGSMPAFTRSPQEIRRALSKERLGGTCIINITGRGETLLPKEMPSIIYALLKEGHYLEVVTNGTLTKRFDEIVSFPRVLLNHLEFKFSFHYMEFIRLGILDQFFNNVNMIRDAGCSFTLELMPYDELIPYIEDIKNLCLEKVGAVCQVTVGRNDTDGRSLLTSLSREGYEKTWNAFDSTMFKFKMDVYNVKRKEFCYAGMWSLYVDLISGEARRCYGFEPEQNIYDLSKPIDFKPVGHSCKQPFCYNAHAYLSLGLIPELDTPTYADIRNRETIDGKEWLSADVKTAFSAKLGDDNSRLSNKELVIYYASIPFNTTKMLIRNKFYIPKIKRKIVKLIRDRSK